MVIAICIGMIDKTEVNTIDGPTKLVRQDAILDGLSICQLTTCSTANISLKPRGSIINVFVFVAVTMEWT